MQTLIHDFHALGAIKFGSFTLKSGLISPVYLDLRTTISSPRLIYQISEAIIQAAAQTSYELVCGVPYTALPFATAVSLQTGIPMVLKRKEKKEYGTAKMVEGVFRPKQKCLLIEDVITSGQSVLETIRALEEEGLVVEDVVVIVDREQGGRDAIEAKGYRLHSLFTMRKMADVLALQGKILPADRDALYLQKDTLPELQKKSEQIAAPNPFFSEDRPAVHPLRSSLSWEDRKNAATHPMARKLFEIIAKKETNLAFACDVSTQAELLYWAETLGPFLCVLKTHIDILEDFTPACTQALRKIAERHGFLIFEDRKFADIGQTVSLQYAQGLYRIADWADLVNAHIVPGEGIIDGLRQAQTTQRAGLLLLAEMSSAGTLATGAYTQQAVALAEANADFVCGFICLRKLSQNPGMIHFTPGVKLSAGIDSLGQQYRTVKEILSENCSDVIIVGRDICKAPDPLKTAALYRKEAWECRSLRHYTKRNK